MYQPFRRAYTMAAKKKAAAKKTKTTKKAAGKTAKKRRIHDQLSWQPPMRKSVKRTTQQVEMGW